jgi:hypothetical protein
MHSRRGCTCEMSVAALPRWQVAGGRAVISAGTVHDVQSFQLLQVAVDDGQLHVGASEDHTHPMERQERR